MSTFGVLKNAIKIDEKVILNDSDFISIDGFQFYYKKGKLYFDKENISIPYPQMDLHLKEVYKK